jgi:hypothetical protein
MKYLKKILFPTLCTIMMACSESGYVPTVVTPAVNTQTGVVNGSYAPGSVAPTTQSLASQVAAANGLGTGNGTGNCGCGCGCTNQQTQLVAQPQMMVQAQVAMNPYLYAYRYQMNPNYYVWNYASGNCVPSRTVVTNSPCGQTNTGCSACANSGCSACASSACAQAAAPCSACANSPCSSGGCAQSACASGGCAQSACAQSTCSACANSACSSGGCGQSPCAQQSSSPCSACSACSRCRQVQPKIYTYNQELPCGNNPYVDSKNQFISDGSDDSSPSTSKTATKLKMSIIKDDARALYERLAVATNDQSDGVTLRIGNNYKCWVEGDGNSADQYGCDLVINFTDGSVGLPRYDVAGESAAAEITNQAFTGSNVQVGATGLQLNEANVRIGDEKGLASYLYSRLPGTNAVKVGTNIKCYALTKTARECMMRFQVDAGLAEKANP